MHYAGPVEKREGKKCVGGRGGTGRFRGGFQADGGPIAGGARQRRRSSSELTSWDGEGIQGSYFGNSDTTREQTPKRIW